MAILSGVNLAGQSANPQNELDFQIERKLEIIARSIETHESIVSVDSTAGTSLLSSTGCTESAV